MKRFFPPMFDEPEKGMPFALLAYWGFAFVGIPLFLPLIGDGLWHDLQAASWLQFAYHLVNGLVVVAMLRTYLADSFLNVQMYPKKFFAAVGIAVALMLILMLEMRSYFDGWAVDAYPISEMSISVTSGLMVEQLPLFGTLCHALITPFTVVGMFYVVGFSPLCCRKAWLGYLVVALLTLIPSAFDIVWRGDAKLVIITCLMRLPIHLIACWSYQKADTVWAPITSLAACNLAVSVLWLLI